MSIFTKIGSAVKSVASKVGSAVSSAYNTVKKVVSGGSQTANALQGTFIRNPTTTAIINTPSGLPSKTSQILGAVIPGYAQVTNKSYSSSPSGIDPLAYQPSSVQSSSSSKLSSNNVPSTYSATSLTSADSGVSSSDSFQTMGADITPYETPMYLGANQQGDAGVGSYLTNSALASGSTPIASSLGANQADTAGQDFQTEEEKRIKKNQEDLIAMMNDLAGVPKEKANLEAQAGIPQATSELQDLQAKQQLQTAQYLQQQQDIQNKPIANEFIAGQQGEVQRRYGIDAMITSALVQSKQGQIQTAQATIDQAMNLKYDTITKRIDTQKAILQMNYDNLTRSDQKLADERSATLDAQKADLTQFKGIQTEAAKQAMSSGDTTAFQAIMNATSYEELGTAGGQYAPAGTFADFSTFTSTLTPTQQQNFSNVPDDLKTSVQDLVNGDILLGDLVKSRGIQGTQQIQKLLNYAQSVDPNYSVNTEKQRYAFKQKWVNDSVQGSVGSRTAINTALGHLADLSEASKALPGGVLKKMNSVKNVLSKEFGDPAVTNFRITLNALGSELARVYKGGVPDASEVTGWQDALAASFSKSQLNGAFNTASKLLSSKITGLRYTYKTAMGKEYDQTVIDPDKRQALINAGINPDSIISENLPKATAGIIPAGGFAEAW